MKTQCGPSTLQCSKVASAHTQMRINTEIVWQFTEAIITNQQLEYTLLGTCHWEGLVLSYFKWSSLQMISLDYPIAEWMVFPPPRPHEAEKSDPQTVCGYCTWSPLATLSPPIFYPMVAKLQNTRIRNQLYVSICSFAYTTSCACALMQTTRSVFDAQDTTRSGPGTEIHMNSL